MSQRSKLGLLQLLLAQPCADFRLYNVPRYMLYIATYSTACVFVDWVDKLVSFERAAKRNENDYSKCPLHLLLCCCCCCCRELPHIGLHYAIMRQISSLGKRILACCNTPAPKRLGCTPKNSFNICTFFFLSPYIVETYELFVYLRIFMSISVDHVQTTRTIISTNNNTNNNNNMYSNKMRDCADSLSIDWQMSI